VVPAVALAGCSQVTIDAARVQSAVGSTFTRLYALQQREVGHAGPPPVVRTSCAKGGQATATGAGDDWSCVVLLYPSDGAIVNAPYDVQVKADGCFTATGPPGVVGQQTVQDTSGRTVTNPIYQFDGCFRLD
jgi:hypothetical protein